MTNPGIFFPSTLEQDYYNILNMLEEQCPKVPVIVSGKYNLDFKVPRNSTEKPWYYLKALYPDHGCNPYDMNRMVSRLTDIGCDFFIHINDDVVPVRYWLEHILEAAAACGGPDNVFFPQDGINTLPMSNFHAFGKDAINVLGKGGKMYREVGDTAGPMCYFLDTIMVLLAYKYKRIVPVAKSFIIHQNHATLPRSKPRANRQRLRTIKQDLPLFIQIMHEEKINAYKLLRMVEFQEELKELDREDYLI